MARQCCDVVYWKHADGWDVYRKEDCVLFGKKWVPRWFDMFIVEDCPTLADAKYEINTWHPLNVCLVTS